MATFCGEKIFPILQSCSPSDVRGTRLGDGNWKFLNSNFSWNCWGRRWVHSEHFIEAILRITSWSMIWVFFFSIWWAKLAEPLKLAQVFSVSCSTCPLSDNQMLCFSSRWRTNLPHLPHHLLVLRARSNPLAANVVPRKLWSCRLSLNTNFFICWERVLLWDIIDR